VLQHKFVRLLCSFYAKAWWSLLGRQHEAQYFEI